MRTKKRKLKSLQGERKQFVGKFERYGMKSGWRGNDLPTILLVDIRHEGNIVADHLWLNLTKGFQELGELHEGQEIVFCARVKSYLKEHFGRREDVFDRPISRDWKLSHPTKITLKVGLPL